MQNEQVSISLNFCQGLADEEDEAWSKKVLNNFLESNPRKQDSFQRLKEIPARRKKRLVILKWLAEKFEVGANYPESEVNETLKRYHPDYATLRRELVINQLMQREHGVYWRL